MKIDFFLVNLMKYCLISSGSSMWYGFPSLKGLIEIIGVAPITQSTHVCNKHSNTQGSSSDFPYLKGLLLKERIRSLWEQMKRFRSLWEQLFSLKRSSHFENGRNCRESLLHTVVFDVRNFFSVLAKSLELQKQSTLSTPKFFS